MKNSIFLTIGFIIINSIIACRPSVYQKISVKDTNTVYHFEAEYPQQKTKKLKSYLDSAFNKNVTMVNCTEVMFPLGANENFTLNAREGYLEINFDKGKSSLQAYLRVKKIVDGIKEKLN